MATQDELNKSAQSQLRVLAVFFHDYQFGRVLGGVERRFVEVTKRFAGYGFQTMALEYPPSIGKALPSGYESILIKKKTHNGSIGEAFQLIRLSALTLIWGRRFGCDVVYSPSGSYWQVIPAYFASRLLRKPLVIVFHSLPGNCNLSFASNLKTRLSRGDSIRRSFFKTTIQALRKRAYEAAGAHIAVSRATAREIREKLSPKNLIVAGNGVGDEWFVIDRVPPINEACFLGRISPRKGVDLILLAWELVVRERPDAKLVLIGGGEGSKYIRSCHEQIKRLRLEDNVSMTGFLDDHRVRLVLSSSRLFLLPSKREGFGLAVIEAMAIGLPCVLSGLPSLKENFGDSAVFVERADPWAWAHSICQLLDDERSMKHLSELGRKRALGLRWDAVANREAETIRAIVGSRLAKA